MIIIKLLLTVLAATIGALVIKHFKVPGGIILGSILFTGIYNVITEAAYMPIEIKSFAQIVTGSYLGSIATRDDIKHLPKVMKPFLLVMFAFISVNLVSGFIIYYTSPMDMVTSLLSTMPGGVSDSVLIALDMGGDITNVAVMQLMRLFFGIGMLPFIIRFAYKIIPHDSSVQDVVIGGDNSAPPKKPRVKAPMKHNILGGIIVCSCGLVGMFTNIAADVMIFSMVSMLLVRQTLFEHIKPTDSMRNVGMVLIGSCIGAQITRAEVAALPHVIGPIFIMFGCYTLWCFVFGAILNKKFKFGLIEGMLCLSPAGATEMVLVASDMGIDSTNLSVIQVGRLITVMAVCPQLITIVASFFD